MTQQTDFQPNIETCAKEAETKEVINWIAYDFTIKKQYTACSTLKVQLSQDTNTVTCTVKENIVRSRHTSICFDSNCTSWRTEEGCAYDSFQSLRDETRRDVCGWMPALINSDNRCRFTNDKMTAVSWAM